MAKPWLTRAIGDSIRFKEETYKLAKESNRSEDWEQFKIQQRRTKGVIKKGKIEYESTVAGNIKSDKVSMGM